VRVRGRCTREIILTKRWYQERHKHQSALEEKGDEAKSWERVRGEEANSSISSFSQHLNLRPHCPNRPGQITAYNACVWNTGAQILRLARRYAKQISFSYKFGTSELNGASKNSEIKECTGDEWRCEWERVARERGKGGRKGKRTQTERTKLPAMVIEVEQRVKQQHCWSRFLADWTFRLLTPAGSVDRKEQRAIELFWGGKRLSILCILFLTHQFWFNWAVAVRRNKCSVLFIMLT